MRIAAVIQARMTSTRLPGKPLLAIHGQPLIWHVVHRLRQSRHINAIVIATTANADDDPLAAWALANDVLCVRGSEDDVLGRFALAAELTDPDIIVRVTGDAPLVDPAFTDGMLDQLLQDHADFVVVPEEAHALHEGVDPMSRRALNVLLAEARHDPVAREHVTAWLKHHPDRVKVTTFHPPTAYTFGKARLSVDTPSDKAFIEAIYQRLEAQAGEASLTDLITLLKRDPSLLSINGHVRQKTATQASGIVVIRCDGGHALGLGHIKRCLALARALRDGQGLGVVFAVAGDDEGIAAVRSGGWRVDIKPDATSEAAWLQHVVRRHRAAALVLDVRTSLGESDVRGLRPDVALIVALDDISPRRLAAHLAVYPPVPQTRTLEWPQGSADLYVGWQWTIMGGDVWNRPRPLLFNRRSLRVLVAMGGSDPNGLTARTVRAIMAAGKDLQPVIVIGPSVADPQSVVNECHAAAPDAEMVLAPSSVMDVAADCDLAILAYGVTAFECAHVGTPAIYLGLTADHAQSAESCARAGFGINLGVIAGLKDTRITAAVSDLAADAERRRLMSAAGRQTIDGRAAERLAADIAQRIHENALLMQQVLEAAG